MKFILAIIVIGIPILLIINIIIVNVFLNKLKQELEKKIKSLGKDDFTIINEIKSGSVKVYPPNYKIHGDGIEYANKILDLDGNIKIGWCPKLNERQFSVEEPKIND